MRQRRLAWLLAVMVGLGVLRLILPSPLADRPLPIAEPIVRRSAAPRGEPPTPAKVAAIHLAEASGEDDVPGNAFAARLSPPPPPLPQPAPAIAPAAVVVAPPPVVPLEIPAPPPYQVVGTWDDGKEPAVFLSNGRGTLLARQGAVLNAEYQVTALTPTEISLMHLPSKRETRLPIARPSSSQRSFTTP